MYFKASILIICTLLALLPEAGAQMELPENTAIQYIPIQCCTGIEASTVGSVNSFMEDDRGFMWIGSENGLFRYDGFHIMPYYELSDHQEEGMYAVSTMAKDDKGGLFAGLLNGEILWINPLSLETKSYRLPVHLSNDNIIHIHGISVRQGTVWGATETGLFHLKLKEETFEFFKPSAQQGFEVTDDVLYSLYPDPEQANVIWIGSAKGLLEFNTAEQRFYAHKITFDNHRLRSEQNFGYLKQLTGKEALWCSGYASGVRVFDQSTLQWKDLLDDAFRQDIMAVQKIGDDFFVIHYDHGAGKIEFDNRSIRYFRDPSLKVAAYEQHKYHAIYGDEQDNLWIGSDAGFCQLSPNEQSLQHIFLPPRSSESEFFFTSSLEDMEDYYLAITSFGHCFYKYYKSDGRIEIVPNPIFKETDSQLDIFHSLKKPDGTVDIFSRKGIWRYYPGDSRIEPVNINIVAYHAERWDGRLVIMTGRNTLQYLEDYRVIQTLDFDSDSLPDINRITDYTIEDGQLWLTGDGSIIRIRLADGEITAWQNGPAQTYFEHAFLNSIEKVGNILVVGNRSAGFETFELVEDQLVNHQHYPFDRAGRGLNIFSSERKGNKVYLSSNQGLLIYDVEQENVLQIDKTDGLLVQNLGKTWTSRLTPLENGITAISGHGFFTLIKEAAFELPAPRLSFAHIRQAGQIVSPEDWKGGLSLPHDENYFELAFSVYPFDARNKLRYRHRLSGHDNNWVSSENGEIRYTSIPPGEYSLEIQASADYQWDTAASLSLAVKVVPPFYQTYWFYAFCTLAALSAGAYLYKKRIQYIKQRESLKSEFNKKVAQLEMEALRAQMNPHFIFNALNSIEYYINQQNTKDAVNYLQKFAALIRMTLQNSKQPYISLQEELASVRYYIEIEQMRLDNSFDYRLEVEESLRPESIQIPPLLLQPYVENAIWHGLLYQKKRRGMLLIQCEHQNHATLIRIRDNGIGRKKAAEIRRNTLKNKKSMGMIITRRRMELNQSISGINTEVAIKDLISPNGHSEGTSVIIHLTKTRETS